jgi:hypothetical protein
LFAEFVKKLFTFWKIGDLKMLPELCIAVKALIWQRLN